MWVNNCKYYYTVDYSFYAQWGVSDIIIDIITITWMAKTTQFFLFLKKKILLMNGYYIIKHQTN